MRVRACQAAEVSAITNSNAGNKEAHPERLVIILLRNNGKRRKCHRNGNSYKDAFFVHHYVPLEFLIESTDKVNRVSHNIKMNN
jgi:hypothetical protein